MLDKLKAYGFQALAMALLVLTVILVAKLYAAKLDVERARSALSAERESRAQENKDRMQAALDDARETFRKGEIHARNQQEIADAHAEQEKRRVARLAAAAADGVHLRLTPSRGVRRPGLHAGGGLDRGNLATGLFWTQAWRVDTRRRQRR